MAQSLKQGWFFTKGRPGDRTLGQQLTGLHALIERVPGKTILDVGCAEGLIGIHLYDAGASAIHGLEIVPGHVKVANELRGDRACTFEMADANTFEPKRDYDVVLMLAILQKLRNPSAACLRFAQAARELVVLRLPPKTAPLILDERSGMQPFDMDETMKAAGFQRFLTTKGAYSEWVGYYAREMM